MNFDKQRARSRARRRYPRSRGFQVAYVRGASAAAVGLSPSACPYRKRSRYEGWRGPWRAAWLAGYNDEKGKPNG